MAGAVLLTSGTGVGSGGFRAVINRAFLSDFGYAPGSAQTAISVTCTPVDGVPPYSYSWAPVGSSDIFPTHPNAATTYFTAYGTVSGTVTDDFICTVTDATAATTETDPVTVSLRFSTGGEDMDTEPL